MSVSLAYQTLEEIKAWRETSRDRIKDCLYEIERLETMLPGGQNPTDTEKQVTEIKRGYQKLEGLWIQQLDIKTEELRRLIKGSTDLFTEVDSQVSEVQKKIYNLNSEMDHVNSDTLEYKINLALLNYRG